MNIFNQDFQEFISSLNSNNVEYLLVGGYAVIFDTSSGMNMLYTNPKYDVSDEVLEKLGYKN